MKYYSKKIKAHPILDELSNISVQVNMPELEHDGEESAEPSIATLLHMALVGEYQQWDLYVSYASRLKGMARNAVADEFKDHAGEEQSHIDLLQRYLVSMGVNPTLQRKPIPELAPEATMRDIVELQLKFEKDAVDLYKKILSIIPDNEPLKLDIETILVKEQEHVHDLELLLKDPVMAKTMVGANAKSAVKTLLDDYFTDREKNLKRSKSVVACQTFRPKEAGEPTKPQAGYGKDNCCFLTKVDKSWCAKALKELTPDLYARWHQGKLLSAEEKAFVAQAIALKGRLKDKRAILRLLDL